MRRIVILIVAAGLAAGGTSSAAAQLPQVPLPDVQLPVPELPDVELPKPPGDDGGGSDPDPLPKLPVLEGGSGGGSGGTDGSGSTSGGAGSTGSGSSDGSGGGAPVGSSSGGGSSGASSSGTGGSSRSGGGGGGAGAYVCPCAAPATGYPVAGDYDKCPEQGGAATAGAGAVLATARSERSGGDENGRSGGVLGATALGEDASEPPSTGAARFFEDSGPSLLAWAVLGLAAVTLLFGVVGGLRAFEGRRG